MATENELWRPSASINNLQLRAKIIARIRQFFAERNVLEVETPLLSHSTTSAVHIASFTSIYQQKTWYLQTSPEFAMKRLLAAGSGAIYQISKAFRQDEQGKRHNPEFTLLEWYRPNVTHHELMNEVNELLKTILPVADAERLSYAEIFQHYLQIDAHHSSITQLKTYAEQHGLVIDAALNRDDWLNLLLTHFIEPHLGKERPLFIYDYPASQAALARIRPGNPPVAERFEVYIQGLELANGYHELTNAEEQRLRFEQDNLLRKQAGLLEIPLDHYLLAALAYGLPNCSGIALGIDRLTMLAAKTNNLSDVISFSLNRA